MISCGPWQVSRRGVRLATRGVATPGLTYLGARGKSGPDFETPKILSKFFINFFFENFGFKVGSRLQNTVLAHLDITVMSKRAITGEGVDGLGVAQALSTEVYHGGRPRPISPPWRTSPGPEEPPRGFPWGICVGGNLYTCWVWGRGACLLVHTNGLTSPLF